MTRSSHTRRGDGPHQAGGGVDAPLSGEVTGGVQAGDDLAALQAHMFALLPDRVGRRIRAAQHVHGGSDAAEFGFDRGLQRDRLTKGLASGAPRPPAAVDPVCVPRHRPVAILRATNSRDPRSADTAPDVTRRRDGNLAHGTAAPALFS
jgi:hypothetical protein